MRSCFPGAMLGVVAHAQLYWSEEVDVRVILPNLHDVQRLFLNTNWAHRPRSVHNLSAA